MIEPPAKGSVYPGRLPTVGERWRSQSSRARIGAVGGAVVILALFLAVMGPAAGGVVDIFLAGATGATVVYVKNRTDRHNAAVERGEIATAEDLHLLRVGVHELPAEVSEQLATLGFSVGDVWRLYRFDGGWIARPARGAGLGVVLGDDGTHASFDPGRVSDAWAASEYAAGRR